MAVDGLEMDFLHRFILMRRDPNPENEAEKQAWLSGKRVQERANISRN